MKTVLSNQFHIIHVPIISEGHLTEAVFEDLQDTEPGDEFFGALCMVGCGAMVHCESPQLLSKNAPECLRKVVEWGKGKGFEWVRLDADGSVIKVLALHDW